MNDILVAAPKATVSGLDGDDTLYGAENARLYGGLGNDTFFLHGDNNQAWGSDGENTFVIQRGCGAIVIHADSVNSRNKLQFGPDIARADIRLEKSGSYDLVIKIGQDGDRVTFKDWFYKPYADRRLAYVSFADGATFTLKEFLEQTPVHAATNGSLDGNDNVNDLLVAAPNSTVSPAWTAMIPCTATPTPASTAARATTPCLPKAATTGSPAARVRISSVWKQPWISSLKAPSRRM